MPGSPSKRGTSRSRSPSSRSNPSSPEKGGMAPMPPSSLARPTSPILTMRPSHRAEADTARIKARKDRKTAMPGPGTYSPVVIATNRETLAGSSAFKSKSDRAAVVHSSPLLNQTGDPGAYEDPKGFLSVSVTSRAASRTLDKAGKAGFGGTEKRTLVMSNMTTKPPTSGWTGAVEDTPGPAAYDSQVDEKGKEYNMYKLNGVEKMKSAAFASTLQRAPVTLRNAYVPGPGTYSPNDAATIEHLPGANPQSNTISKTGRDHHFVADNLDGMGEDSSTQPHVGPGSYNSHLSGTVENESKKGKEKQSQAAEKATPGSGSLGFGSRSNQRELPHEGTHGAASEAEATPGPGQYDPKTTEHGLGLTADAATKDTFATSAKNGRAGFGTQAVARGVEIGSTDKNVSMGDANAYNPNHNRELAYDAKQTFQTSSKAGKAGFGGVEKRSLLLSNMITKPPGSGWTGPIEDTPGPAAYDSQVDEKGREHNMYTLNGVEKMKSAAFASKSQRATVVLPNAFVPGPGAYKPDDSATIEHLPGANPKANPLSKTGRDHHFVADNLDGMGDDSSTQPHVGPGSYNSHLHLTISRAWEVAAEELPHASFMSDTFRTIYTGQNE